MPSSPRRPPRKKGATKTPSGLVYRPIKEGTGASPKATDTVKVHYNGTLPDGRVFDTSLKGEPATFPLNGVIKCWTEGVQLMKVGGKSKLVCPSEIAYGDRGAGALIQPGATLIFEVELLEIVSAAGAPSGGSGSQVTPETTHHSGAWFISMTGSHPGLLRNPDRGMRKHGYDPDDTTGFQRLRYKRRVCGHRAHSLPSGAERLASSVSLQNREGWLPAE